MKKKSSNGYLIDYESRYLQELIDDFPCKKKLSLKQAQKLLISRYLQLEKKIPYLLQILEEAKVNQRITKLYPSLSKYNDPFPAYFFFLIGFFHEYLFKGILNNAGEFRKANDPFCGMIGFGGYDYRVINKFKYYGSSCNEIENDLKNCFILLKKNPEDHLAVSVDCYRRFVKIHPYYDGNGRIGRLILTIYNLYHGYYITWSEFEVGSNKTKFIKKLNE